MVTFSYEKIFLLAEGNPKKMLELFSYHCKTGQLNGINWIINEQVVLENTANTNTLALAEYLGLCALRDNKTHAVDLPLINIPRWIPLSLVVQDNPLVEINSATKTLHFKFEE